jgi:hypothetical protein
LNGFRGKNREGDMRPAGVKLKSWQVIANSKKGLSS